MHTDISFAIWQKNSAERIYWLLKESVLEFLKAKVKGAETAVMMVFKIVQTLVMYLSKLFHQQVSSYLTESPVSFHEVVRSIWIPETSPEQLHPLV